MQKLDPLNRVLLAGLGLTAFLAVLCLLMSASDLILLLNGLFAGAAAAIVIAYWRLLVNALLGIRPYDRVRQMTLGFFLVWVAYSASVLVSIYFRSADIHVNSTYATAASRYIAVIAATLQVTAPDFGLGIFHGRDRKVLVSGILIGGFVAAGTILAQYNSILTWDWF